MQAIFRANAAAHCKDSRVANNVAVQMREYGCLAVCITVRPSHLLQAFKSFSTEDHFAEFGSLRYAKPPLHMPCYKLLFI
jgi:hypothetical protein